MRGCYWGFCSACYSIYGPTPFLNFPSYDVIIELFKEDDVKHIDELGQSKHAKY